ncbi:hypothetical protein CDD80_3791 [Ophiocordyceps camponoti-rufipedis]|uniref:FYVE-type domain-containing protein n=1 Tax=Ophiocordyceps camponoti-rufipedis TaxID=2004952 RepID=A0A2C5YNZ5_9HYPO|nr:hypothetical protein CDD80_3791 [Ophiocordyceps camponoti-rufipedis]
MSARTLGGGRILGSGRGLAPPTPPRVSSRSGSPFAPSESSASMTLLQLNRHIDDNHQELPEQEQDEVKTWFDKQVLKAKRFQPLTLINQKLRGLDVFESNESNPLPHTTATLSTPSNGKQPATVPIDPDDLITRNHWQRSTAHDVCTDPTCGRGLGPLNGSINCRKCGRLFCEEHTMYQMKLSRSANHEPVRGYWARVCETCYKSREGYNDHVGLEVDHTGFFVGARCKRLERQKLETARLEKRLTKLTRLLAEMPEGNAVVQGGGSLLSPVSSLIGHKDPRKLLEQSVVPWEDDDAVSKCPFCQQEFGSWTFRRHHCRICGRVVCADVQTGCSSEVGLNIRSAMTTPYSEKSAPQLQAEIRMCRDCKQTIFSHRDFTTSLEHKPPDQKAYETLRQFERGILLLLPSFHRSLVALQPPGSGGSDASSSWSSSATQTGAATPTQAQIHEAAKIRKRLMDSFAKYGAAAKRLRALKAESRTQARLQEAVYSYASSFLHTNMLPLKSLPQRDAKQRLAILREQRQMVEDMVGKATAARRFDEVAALARNRDELDVEIEGVERLVSEVDGRWEGVYANGA